jgi:RNA recognition motif-containing protein
MGGVGSFNRSNRTLYIGKMQESPDKKQTEETLLRHFGEWGKIVKCRSLSSSRDTGLTNREYPVQSWNRVRIV